MNEGRWTPSPHVEREAAVLRHRLRWEGNLNVWVAGVSACVAMGAGLAALDRAVHGRMNLATILLALAAWFGAALTFWIAIRDHRLKQQANEADRERRGELGQSVGWLVDLMVLQGDAPTGSDRGMLWFEDGRLCFSGDRTSFALTRDQVFPSERVGAVPGLRHAVRLRLDHRTDAGRLALSVRAERENALRASVDRWIGPRDSAPGQLPPTSLGPGAPSLRRLFLTTVLVTVGWVPVGLLLWCLWQVGASVAFACLAGVVLWTAVTRPAISPALRWRAFEHRERLGRGP